MNCREARDLLPLLDRDGLSPRERDDVERHAGACFACAGELAATRETVDLLREATADLLSDPPTAEEFREMLGAVEPVSRRRRPLLRLAAAALVLAAIGGGWLLLWPTPAEEPATDLVVADEEGGETLDARFEAAMVLLRRLELAQAEAAFRGVAEACGTEEERNTVGVRARLKVGECLYRQEKYLEAFEVYGKIVEEYRESAPDEASQAAYYRFRSAAARFARTRTKEDEARRDSARDAFMTGFPDHPLANDLFYYRGADVVAQADGAAVGGRADEAKKLYERAIAVYLDMVKPSSSLYEKARARIGECLFKLERYDDALTFFRMLLSPTELATTTDLQRLANRRQAQAIAVYYGARCLRAKEDWKGVLEITDGFEKAAEDRMVRLLLPPVTLERVRALVALSRLDAAESEIMGLVTDFAKAEGTPEACRILGSALLETEGHAAVTKATYYLDFFLEHANAATAEDHAEVARLYEQAGEFVLAESRMKTAVRMAREELGKLEGHAASERAQLEDQLRGLEEALERIRAAKDR